jgi:hypothetical protein
LLRKRDEPQSECASLREQMAIVSNDVEAIDRVLEAFAFEGNRDRPRFAAAAVSALLFSDKEMRYEFRHHRPNRCDWGSNDPRRSHSELSML